MAERSWIYFLLCCGVSFRQWLSRRNLLVMTVTTVDMYNTVCMTFLIFDVCWVDTGLKHSTDNSNTWLVLCFVEHFSHQRHMAYHCTSSSSNSNSWYLWPLHVSLSELLKYHLFRTFSHHLSIFFWDFRKWSLTLTTIGLFTSLSFRINLSSPHISMHVSRCFYSQKFFLRNNMPGCQQLIELLLALWICSISY